jgi:predicted dehydrogenase
VLIFKFPLVFSSRKNKDIAIIGCGQFAFATIAYFLKLTRGYSVYGVFDINKENAKTLASYYKCKVFDDYMSLLNSKKIKYVYIASNHSSHAYYAIEALKRDKIVYVEKPIAVNNRQYLDLLNASKEKKMFIGYNRPFAPAIQIIKDQIQNRYKNREPISINQFVIGHKIPSDHWYRNFEEGTRICGNVGHWLDLSIHLLAVIGLPNKLRVTIIPSSEKEKDDNLNLTITSDFGDLITIMLSSREEPFEGINESINIQYSRVIAKIDDFRKLTIWDGDKILKRRYFRKDVGHKKAINQPFDNKTKRDVNEVLLSTRLMLDITDAVRNDKKEILFII